MDEPDADEDGSIDNQGCKTQVPKLSHLHVSYASAATLSSERCPLAATAPQIVHGWFNRERSRLPLGACMCFCNDFHGLIKTDFDIRRSGVPGSCMVAVFALTRSSWWRRTYRYDHIQKASHSFLVQCLSSSVCSNPSFLQTPRQLIARAGESR